MNLHTQRKEIIKISIYALILFGVLAAFTWANYRFALRNPGGNNFLPYWVGTRSLLTQGLSPYSGTVALKTQQIAYGRPALPGEDQLRVKYPLYSVALFFPLALISDFIAARSVWMTLLESSIILLVVLSARLTGWRMGIRGSVVLILFCLSWYHGLRPLVNGNGVILVASLVTGGLLAIKVNEDELAGVLLAFSTFIPQVVIVFLLYIVFWSVSKRRWRLIAWFAGTIVLLSITAVLLIPDWMLQNLREVVLYPSYNPPATFGSAVSEWLPYWGKRAGTGMTVLLTLILLAAWIYSRRLEFKGFLWTACLTLTASQWIGIKTDPGNFVILFPVLLLVFALLAERWKAAGRNVAYIIMTVVGVGIWLLFAELGKTGNQILQNAVMFFPLPGLLLVALLWTSWWAFRSPSTWQDELSLSGSI